METEHMKQLTHRHAGKLVVILLMVLLVGATASAQEQEQPAPSAQQTAPRDEQASPDPSTRRTDATQAQPEESLSTSFDKPTTNLATGTVLTTTRSPFRWGNLSVLSVDALQVYDSNYFFLKNNPCQCKRARSVRCWFMPSRQDIPLSACSIVLKSGFLERQASLTMQATWWISTPSGT